MSKSKLPKKPKPSGIRKIKESGLPDGFYKKCKGIIVMNKPLEKFELYQKAINQIDDFLEYQYVHFGIDGIKEKIMEIIDELTRKLKALQ